MKKIYMPMLLAVSLYSANAVEPAVYTHQGQFCEENEAFCRSLVNGMPTWLTVYGDDIGVSSHMCVSPCSDYSFFREQSTDNGKPYAGRPYTIHNNSGKSLKGFRFYHYFNAQPSGKFDVKVYHYFHAYRVDRGGMYRDEAIQPDSIKIERLSAIQYRVLLDYSSVTIPSGKRFPEEGAFYVRVSSNETVNGKRVPVTDWTSEGHELKGFAITKPSGKILYGPELNNQGKKEFPTIDNLRRVGVLWNYQYCSNANAYGWVNLNRQSDTLLIRLDTEDDDSATKITDKDNNTLNSNLVGVTVTGGMKDVVFRYCAIDTASLPQARYDYAVLSLDSLCPEGSYRFARKHDTENDENGNSYAGQIWPNDVNYGDDHDDAMLYYCFVPKNSSAPNVYHFVNAGYGVFGKKTDSYVDYYKLIIDDDDDHNSSSWNWFDTPSDMKSRIRAFMKSDDNVTRYYVLQQKGLLSKSAAEVAESPISKGQPLVTAAPLAPAIKGLSRSAVAVELKSAGDVKVSIVGVNGAVIANIAEKGLLAGAHQIKWNAGMVPSGRYVVKIEQNGMVNAKNVILK